MCRLQNIIFPLLLIMAGCNNQDGSAFDELLAEQPYAPLTDSLEKFPNNADLFYRRGILLYKNQNYPPAVADFKKAWELNKKEEYAAALSTVYMNGRTDSAILFLKQAIKILPQSIRLKLNLAEAYADKQDYHQALAVTDEILSAQPNQIDALILKSDLLDKLNDNNNSLKVLEQAYHLAPFDEDLCYNLAFKYAEQKNEKVLALCDSLQKADRLGKKGEPYYFKGLYFSNIGDGVKAISFFNHAILHDYYYLNAYIEKGKVYFNQNKYPEALKVFTLVSTISPDFPDAYFWMGKCQEALGKKNEARLNYQRAYGLDKTFAEAKEAAERLKD
ncbi:MAG: hypothetical protein C4308_03445 [Chitinophagaceae bacterium]